MIDDDNDDVILCPICIYGYGQFLGVMGNSAHFRCAACGGQWSEKYQEVATTANWEQS